MKTSKIFIALAVSVLLVSMIATVSAAEIPRATAPLNATEEQILIVENLIGDILDEVQNGLGYAEAENKVEPRIYKAVITGQTNGNGYAILSDIMKYAKVQIKFRRVGSRTRTQRKFAQYQWRTNWANSSTYFKYPEAVRTLIYTTNTIEGFLGSKCSIF